MSAQGLVTMHSLYAVLVSPEAREIIHAVTKGGAVEFHYGVHWTWKKNVGELMTEEGLVTLETAFKGAEMHTLAAIVRDLIETEKRVSTPPAMEYFFASPVCHHTTPRAARTRRLPYADPDLEPAP